MPYLLRSRGRLLEQRDGTSPADPLYVLRPGEWYPFVNLPKNMPETGDGDIDVRYVDSIEGYELAPIAVREPPKEPAQPKQEVVTEANKKRKARVR